MLLLKHINKAVIITGSPQNTERWDYPLEALREIILNMIVHRDYRSSYDSIVKIFDNKIEFYNPGGLPADISIEDLLTNNYRSNPRNKIIADFCKDLGLIEKYGSGIQRILNAFKVYKLPAPEFKLISGGFNVTVFVSDYDRVTDRLTMNQREILELLEKNAFQSANDLSKSIGISRRKILENIKKLKDLELLSRIGDNKKGYWQVVK